MTDHPEFSPGCFGSALAYSERARECAVCAFATQCAPAAEARRQALGAKHGIAHLMKPRKTAAAVKPANDSAAAPRAAIESTPTSSLPKKVADLVGRLVAAGVDMTAVSRGRNPLGARPAFLSRAVDMLLAGGFTKRELATAFQGAFNWSDGTAASHVGQVVALLTHFDLAQVDGTRLTPKQRLAA